MCRRKERRRAEKAAALAAAQAESASATTAESTAVGETLGHLKSGNALTQSLVATRDGERASASTVAEVLREQAAHSQNGATTGCYISVIEPFPVLQC